MEWVRCDRRPDRVDLDLRYRGAHSWGPSSDAPQSPQSARGKLLVTIGESQAFGGLLKARWRRCSDAGAEFSRAANSSTSISKSAG